ncbi:4043_t:CDS:2 [Diversispora eburnea]|uniref:4043_t:CDS:1 n=1 Tax=Diversispora eburnea TaxID=1213867 RepID=A0A9N9F6F4_9GLOM|nr:4043_t:CDS:2 [Diversispora eburnea]
MTYFKESIRLEEITAEDSSTSNKKLKKVFKEVSEDGPVLTKKLKKVLKSLDSEQREGYNKLPNEWKITYLEGILREKNKGFYYLGSYYRYTLSLTS